jgi:hypothetical protein
MTACGYKCGSEVTPEMTGMFPRSGGDYLYMRRDAKEAMPTPGPHSVHTSPGSKAGKKACQAGSDEIVSFSEN